jgi:replication factor A1
MKFSPSPLCWKVPVDVMGVVVALGPLGSVKRKSDNSDLQRRDVTLVDQRCVTFSTLL